jgi:2-phospho-L-lactate transferase/gluconeogenesis factor (CofD/UPF0052 family)
VHDLAAGSLSQQNSCVRLPENWISDDRDRLMQITGLLSLRFSYSEQLVERNLNLLWLRCG